MDLPASWTLDPGSMDRPVQASQLPEDPWDLPGDKPLRLLAWPDWDDAEELAFLLGALIEPLRDADEVCLVLRRDPDLDAMLLEQDSALEQLRSQLMSTGSLLALAFEDRVIAPPCWPRLGEAADGVLQLPSARRTVPRGSFAGSLQAPLLESAGQVRTWLADRHRSLAELQVIEPQEE